jgi:hypothetical protein
MTQRAPLLKCLFNGKLSMSPGGLESGDSHVSFCDHYGLFLLIFSPSCLAHVVNLAIVDFMAHVTKIVAIKSTSAIWEYDPSLPENRVLNGSLDVISAICTLAIKVCFVSMPSYTLFIAF